ncbi:acyl-CoA-binding protein [Antarcticibacterium flavum]|uniref:Acyl-CoA-binding protein n=1 Tax=Antarcticibacterium flavum TaxID=2058175 RepID=A0A5B7X4J6_9FLAO|nr:MULTISPECIES: acyl-CoA-binding protein [Antarcticibacterium]MCM4160006.1 acyl-CoA-binding protein [Antarcticibacterium sp. W02-3]QCY70404.1 acyl-CoA-binding protein [Antarcticibacterium flavum]
MTEITDHKFLKAYEMASNTHLRFPPDIMLHFYAYYKRATQLNGFYAPGNDEDIRQGFKANALLQVKDLSREEAKKKYIQMVEKYIGEV